jgi:ADP-ribosylglycohydrolase
MGPDTFSDPFLEILCSTACMDSFAVIGFPMTHEDRLSRASISLEGLAIGDAFGQMFSTAPKAARSRVQENRLPPPPWWRTDDTEMALAIVEVLNRFGRIDQDALAQRFAERFHDEPDRGYGKMARIILRSILRGGDWQHASATAFGQAGSKGNGGAMRVAPLGAWFADDLNLVENEACASAAVTHAHPEGQAGAVAVAVAAAVALQQRGTPPQQAAQAIFDEVLKRTPKGETRDGVAKAAKLAELEAEQAAKVLGSGFLVTAPDTVPYALWSATRHLDNYVEAIVETVAGDGDCDTNCAIVGGIVSLYVGVDGIPATWRAAREKFTIQTLT